MRTLIVTEFISLDGVVEAPGGEPTHPQAGWTMAYGVPESYAFKMKETMDAESMLLWSHYLRGIRGSVAGAGGRSVRGQDELDAEACRDKHVELSSSGTRRR